MGGKIVATSSPYQLGLRLAGRKVLLVGGGAVAQRRLPALLDAAARVTLVAPLVTAGIESLVSAGSVAYAARTYQPSDVDGAWFVLAATDDPVVNAAVAADAERLRIFCVRADEASEASAWTPAVGRHEQVTVAVHAGRDPARAAAIRSLIVERLADGSLDAPPVRPTASGIPGVALVGAGPGDPELITVRGRRLLARAEVVVVDRLAPHLLLDELRSDVEVIDAAKIPYGRYVAQEKINEALVSRALAGKFVVRLKGGDPFVFGRGGEEIEACVAAGVPVQIVPGVTSPIAAPGAAGIPITHRGVAHEFTVVSGHVPPDSPQSLVDWDALGRLRGTLVLMMAIERLPAITSALLAAGRPASTPAAAVQEGTMGSQKVVTGTLATIATEVTSAGLKPPAVVVIGDVVAVAERLLPALS
ncbi:uroporphyrinogen-III C-methyltransferase [Fodinicola feengrottensis]|uniref:Uroporphyrinogen-III C-methyltransferase n=1 Tax=Fodinicola feengrottensis TaxID=435914 RepID=A0ABN2I9S2_9ACTN